MTHATTPERWTARPLWAAFIRVVAFVTPIAASIAFVNLASRVVPMPTGSLALFVGWWALLSGGATAVMVVVDSLSRRLLPIAALFRLSLVFPDRAPSRFDLAMRTGTVEDLEQRLARRADATAHATPTDAATELLGLVATLDRHDRLTRGHCERVRAYAQTIAQELKLSDHDRDLLNWAALLHDVGKLGVPVEILAKEGKPTDEEWELLKQHPRIGEELIAPLRDWLGEWSTAVRDHHERWDGGGYPSGKAGEAIGLAGRIVAVADVFDVITSIRSYKAAFSTAQARSELARNAGSQFDPRIVRAFLNVGLGRLRLIMGPLSWLAHAPVLARLPLTPAVSALTGTVAAVATATAAGLVHPPPPPPLVNPQLAASLPQPRPAASPRPPSAHHSRPQPTHAQPATPARTPLQRSGGPRPAAPIAPMVRWTTDEDAAGTVPLRLPRARDVTRLRLIELPQFGTAAVTLAEAIAYTPPRDFSGTTALGYEACWNHLGCSPGAVAITVRPVDDPPVAGADLVQTLEDDPVSIDALANDTDVDSDDIALVAAWGETHGKATVGGERIGWRPPPDFAGRATFLYAVVDGEGATGVGRAAVDVVPVNDAPLAVVDAAATNEDTPVAVDLLANDSDADGDELRLTGIGAPSAGSATHGGRSVTYSPPPNFDGAALMTYTVGDGHGGAAAATARIDVLPVNDVPTVADDVAEAWTGAVTTVEPLANDTDADDDLLELVSAGPGALGAVTVDGARIRYAAGAAPGEDSFAYVVQDGKGAETRGTVRITVHGVNTAPSFLAGPDQSVPEDAGPQAAAWASAISSGRPDEAGQHVSFTVAATNHTLFAPGGEPALSPNGVLTYTPATNAHGTSTLTVLAHDDGGTEHGGSDTSAPETRTVTIRPVNDAPSAVIGPAATVAEDAGAQVFPAWATAMSPGPPDESGQAVSFVVSTTNAGLFTAGGRPAVSSAGTLTFTPAPDANGSANVAVRARDDGGSLDGGADTGAPQAITITITPVNDVPDAVADAASVNEDAAGGVTVDVLSNDTDADADVLTVSATNTAGITGGTLAQGAGGQFTFVPDAAFNGTQSFSYTVADGHGGSDSETATITVVAQPDAPVAADDAYVTTAGSPVVRAAPGLIANDGDEDGDAVSARTALVVAPASGAVAIAPDGAFTYTPNLGFTGTDSFTYRIDDGTGRSDDAVVTVTVGPTSATTLYLDSTGPTADVWALIAAPPAAASPVPDFDGDGSPGLTIRSSNGAESVSDSARWQAWTKTVSGSPLILNGPVVLGLWSTVANFKPSESAHPHVFLYDCDAGGASCAKLAGTHLNVQNWNGGVADWSYREITIGSVSQTIPVGHELRVRIQVSQHDLWVAMTAAYPSMLRVTES